MPKRRPKFKPPYTVDTWFERNRASIVVYDANDKVVAEWWDEEVDEMVEDGFFNRRNLEDSVLEYLEDTGVI